MQPKPSYDSYTRYEVDDLVRELNSRIKSLEEKVKDLQNQLDLEVKNLYFRISK